MSGDAIDTLLSVFQQNNPALAGARLLFVHAQDRPSLHDMRAAGAHITCLQNFRPHAAPLIGAGFALVGGDVDGPFTHILLHAPKQMAEMRHDVACALIRLEQAGGGALYVAGDNDAGGKRLPALMKEMGLNAHSLSRNHARVVWCADISTYNRDLAARYREEGAVRFCKNSGFYTQAGLFSWDRVDPASAMLLAHLPPLKGRGADFGCGYGFLSHGVLARGDDIGALYCLDADARALICARQNLAQFSGATALHFDWVDLAGEKTGLSDLDFVIMNPPFHQGAQTRSDIGEAFIRRAYAVLRRGQVLYMVANVHLPYEKVIAQNFAACDKLYEGNGFKIFAAVK